MKYCEFCGTRLEDKENCSCPEAIAHAEQKGRKIKSLFFGGIVIAAVLAISALISVISVASKANPLDYVTIEFSGYNTLGEADIGFDCEALIESVIGAEPEAPEEYFNWLADYESYFDSIETSYSNWEALSNGDIVTVKITVTGIAEDKILSAEKDFTVEGLDEIQLRDVFQDIDVSFLGVSGDGKMQVSLLAEDEILSACHFRYSQQYYLAVGDSITISVANAEEIAETYGVVISPVSKDFVVSGLSDFLCNPELLPKDDIKLFAKTFLAESAKEDEWVYSYSEPRYYGTYFCVANQEGFMIAKNVLKIFVCYDEYINGDYRQTVYKSLDFAELVASPDGNVDLSYDMGYCSGFVTDIESCLEELQFTYTVTPIEIDLD